MERTIIRRDRLALLRDKLRTIPEGGFDFGHWGEFYNGVHLGDRVKIEAKCGATGCALGWATSWSFTVPGC